MVKPTNSVSEPESEIIKKIAAEKECFISVLVKFAETDTLLYLPDDLDAGILRDAAAAVEQANLLSNTAFVMTIGLSVIGAYALQKEKMAAYLRQLDDDKLSILYLTATELRSVLLGILFAERIASAEAVFRLAFCEELEQQKQWGTDEATVMRQEDVKRKLKRWETFCYERSLSEN